MNCFKTPQHTNKRYVKTSTSTTNPANDTEEDTSKNLSHNVKRKLVFEDNEDNEENAFIKLNDVCNSIQIGYNGRYSKP